MASQHPSAPWRRLILIPCWIIQILFPSFTFVVVAVDIARIIRDDFDDDGSYDSDVRRNLAIGWVYIVFSGLCIILTVIEIVLMLRNKLTPLVFLIMNIFKSNCWTALFIISLWNAFDVVKKTVPIVVSLIIHIILLLAFYIPLAHGAMIIHGNLKAARYEPINPKHGIYNSSTEPFRDAFPPAYKSFTTIEATPDLEAHDETTGRPRRLSYNHIRDTRFDSYKQSRRSFSDPSVVGSMMTSSAEASPSTRSRSSTLNLPIPLVVVQDHDEFVEMSRRTQMK
ncbi:hypothetical protein NHQ30_011184 [Ciborinia camelliae]|nr:hypothetical protein NHQ30_011184 [Ciborinia camelliae]